LQPQEQVHFSLLSAGALRWVIFLLMECLGLAWDQATGILVSLAFSATVNQANKPSNTGGFFARFEHQRHQSMESSSLVQTVTDTLPHDNRTV